MPPSKTILRRAEPNVPHYYGDITRILMIFGIGLAIFGIPLGSDFMKPFIPYEIAMSVPVVALAALTNPWQRLVILFDVILSGAAAIFFEVAAYLSYDRGELVPFVLYGAIGVLFLLAFYFSTKTFRAMLLGQVGKPDSPVDFYAGPLSKEDKNPLSQEESFSPELLGD